jgi:hypothetical protein
VVSKALRIWKESNKIIKKKRKPTFSSVESLCTNHLKIEMAAYYLLECCHMTKQELETDTLSVNEELQKDSEMLDQNEKDVTMKNSAIPYGGILEKGDVQQELIPEADFYHFALCYGVLEDLA